MGGGLRHGRRRPVTAAAGTDRVAWRDAAAVVGAMTAVQALATFAVLALAAAAPLVAAALGVSPALIGYQIAVIYFGALMTTGFAGPFARRFGAIAVSQIALLCAAAGCLIGMIPGLAFLAIGSMVIGWCYGLTNPAASHLMAQVATPSTRNLIFSLKQTGVPLGGVLAGLAAPLVVLAFGWQALLALAALLAVLLAAMLHPLRRRWDADRVASFRLTGNPLASIGFVWRLRALRFLGLGALFFAAVQLCAMTFAVTLLVEEGGFGDIVAGAVLAVLQVSGVVGRVLWGWVADRVGDGLVLLGGIGIITMLASAGAALVGPGYPLVAAYVVFGLLGLSAAGWNGVMMAETARLAPPGEVARATGGTQFFAFAGVLCGPAGFTLAHGLIGSYAGTYWLLVGLTAAGTAMMLTARAVDRAARLPSAAAAP